MKKLSFVGSSRENLKEFPQEVRQDIGFALVAEEDHDAKYK